MSSGSSCFRVNVSIILGCFGIAPINSNFCTSAAAFAPLPADGAGAELTGDGAAEVSELVWLWGAEAGASVLTPSVVIVGAGAAGTVAVTLKVALALVGLVGDAGFRGLIGDVGLVGFVIDFTHESEVVIQDVNDKVPYGSGHVPTLVCVIDPVYPAGQLRICVSLVGRHVAGSGLQVFWLSVHAPQTAWPYGSWQVLWRM
jgi:hypothetical protein